jgi:hypothetical protein
VITVTTISIKSSHRVYRILKLQNIS